MTMTASAPPGAAIPWRYVDDRETFEQSVLPELMKYNVVYLDLEGPAYDEVRLMQLGGSPPESPVYNVPATPWVWDGLRRLSDKNKVFVSYCAFLFDFPALWNQGIRHMRWRDPMHLYLMTHSGLISGSQIDGEDERATKRGLAAVVLEYEGVLLDKSLQTSFESSTFTDEQMEYAAADVWWMRKIHRKLEAEIKEKDLVEAARLESRVLPAAASMHSAGFNVDTKSWREYIVELAATAKEIQGRLVERLTPKYHQALSRCIERFPCQDCHETGEIESGRFRKKGGAPIMKRCPTCKGTKQTCSDWNALRRLEKEEPINLGSPDQMLDTMLELNIPVESTGERQVKPHSKRHPWIKDHLLWRSTHKMDTTYGEKFLNWVAPDGRIYSFWDQLGAYATGRWASFDPNLQNIPVRDFPHFRDLFVAMDPEAKTDLEARLQQGLVSQQEFDEELDVLVVADFSQIEMRLMAEFSQDPWLLRGFRENLDLHALAGQDLYGYDYEAVVANHQLTDKSLKDPKLTIARLDGKVLNFAVPYGMGTGTVAVELGVDFGAAQKKVDLYWRNKQVLRRWLDDTGAKAMLRGYSETVLGRKRFCPDVTGRDEKWISSQQRMLRNQRVQGTAADILKQAISELFPIFLTMAYPTAMIATIHDELVVRTRKAIAEEVKHLVFTTMMKAASQVITTIPVDVGIAIGDRWSIH